MSDAPPRSLGPDEARAVLAFHLDAGVSEAVADAPVDRFALGPDEGPAPASARAAAAPSAARGEPTHGEFTRGEPDPPPARRAVRPAAPPPPAEIAAAAAAAQAAIDGEAAVMAARAEARTAATLDELRDLLARFEGCPLRYTARNLVFADGNPEADLMLVGEAPGREEDERGLPFVGRSGRLLDRMLAAIGRDRSTAYIANVIPWRPPGNRTPSPIETETCKPFIERQIELAAPKVLVLLGGAAAKVLLGTSDGIMRTRGRWFTYEASGRAIPAMPTLHPAYLLRQPREKRLAWRDFLEIRRRLDDAAGPP